jgi:hypothetical protein
VHGKWNWRDKTPGHHSYLPSSRGHHDDDDEQDEDEDEQDDFEEFDPDELPTLLESAKIVFSSLRGAGSADSPAGKGKTEEEYGVETEERLKSLGGFLLLLSYLCSACCF